MGPSAEGYPLFLVISKSHLHFAERIAMPHDLPKAYEPGAIEPRWAEYWVHEKLFHVELPIDPGRPTFTVTLPPPNVTGNLHMGHM